MKQKTIVSTVLFFLSMGGLYAQETVVATGGDAIGSGGSSSYAVGQLVYTTNTGTSGSASQGVLQSYEISVTTGIEVTEISLELQVYPNPTMNRLNLTINNYEDEKLTYQLYDKQGNLLAKAPVTSNLQSIAIESLPTSTYLLKVTDNKKLVKIFKVIKN